MKEITTLIDDIERKVVGLIDKQKSLESRYFELKEENKQLLEELNDKNELINKLNEQIAILKIAKTVNPDGGTVDVKERINELVREIDTCIEILSD